jgi:hypothetical protein
MTTFTCQFCNKAFPKKQNLTVHQQSAKYCLKIQDQHKITLAEENRILKLTQQELYAIIREKDTLIEQKEKQIQEEKEKLLDLAMKKSTNNITVNNNNNNNKYNFLQQTFNPSPEFIKSQVDSNFTEDHFRDGQKGVALFAFENFIKNDDGTLKYHCSDVARRIFVFKNKNGTITKDVKSELFTKLIANDVIAKSLSIFNLEKTPDFKNTQYLSYLHDIKNIKFDNASFATTLAGLSCNIITYENENGDITYEIIDATTTDEESDVEEEEEEDELRAKYTPQYFENKQKLIDSYPKDSGFYRQFSAQLQVEKEKYRRFWAT